MKKFKTFVALLFCFFVLIGCNTNKQDNSSTTDSRWTVTFDYNDGRGVFYTRKVNDNTVTTKPADPIREGHNFLDWYRDPYCTTLWVFEEDLIVADTTIYANWEEIVVLTDATITWPNEVGFTLTFAETRPTTVPLDTIVTFGLQIDNDYEGAPIVRSNGVKIDSNNGNYSFTASTNIIITVSGIIEKDSGDIEIPVTTYYLEINGSSKIEMTINSNSTAPDTSAEFFVTTELAADDSVKVVDNAGNYCLDWENVDPNVPFVTEYAGSYTFYFKIKTDGKREIYIAMPSRPSIGENYRISFTLPVWDPVATNPRLYYWGSGESPAGTIWTAGAASNMTLDSGSTYYIDIDTSFVFSGIIIIFDQAGEMKQSLDITTNLPRTEGNYEVISDYVWEGSKFKASIVAR